MNCILYIQVLLCLLPLSSWLIRSVRWRHAWPRCATLAVDQQAECLYVPLDLYTVTPPSKHKATQPMLSTKAFNQCCFNVGQRRRSLPKIETVLGECLVFASMTASYFYRSEKYDAVFPPAQKTKGSTSSCYNYVFTGLEIKGCPRAHGTLNVLRAL